MWSLELMDNKEIIDICLSYGHMTFLFIPLDMFSAAYGEDTNRVKSAMARNVTIVKLKL